MPNVHIFLISLENVSFRFYESEVNRKTRSPTPNNNVDMHTKVRFHCYIKRDVSDTSLENDYPV